MKILFLDVDGVLIPMRAYRFAAPRRGRDAGQFRLMDPVAIATILSLLCRCDAKIVLSSVWRKDERTLLFARFAENGIMPEWFHEDYRTPFFPNGTRGDEIRAWLGDHPEVTTYAVLDDETVDVERLVRVDILNGVLYEHEQQLEELLGVAHG